MYDKDDKETEDSEQALKYVYEITARKLIKGVSVSKIEVITPQQKTNVKIELPEEVQVSSPPLEGNFRITCPIEGNDKAEDPMTTREFRLKEWTGWVANGISFDCPNMNNNFELWYDNVNCEFEENCLAWYIRFFEANGPQTPLKMITGKEKPLVCTDCETKSEKVNEASDNIFYEAIPFEMLRTHEMKP